MSKAELETIVLDVLERIEKEARERHESQDEKIRNIEKMVADFARQLMRLSASLRSLQPLTDGLNSILPNGGKR